MSGTTVVGGNAFKSNLYAITLSPASVANATTAEQTFAVNGLNTTDFVYVIKPSNQAGLAITNCRVSAANTLAISFGNVTAATITPTGGEVYTLLHAVSEYQPLQTVP